MYFTAGVFLLLDGGSQSFGRSRHRMFSVKKAILKISQIYRKTSASLFCNKVSGQKRDCAFCKNFKNTFFNRTPPVGASVSGD